MISKMNVRVTIQECAIKIDEIGNHTPIWHDYYTCWAQTSNQTGRESNKLDITSESDRMDFTVRFCAKISRVRSTSFRIILNDRVYNIDHVDDMSFARKAIKFHGRLTRR